MKNKNQPCLFAPEMIQTTLGKMNDVLYFFLLPYLSQRFFYIPPGEDSSDLISPYQY